MEFPHLVEMHGKYGSQGVVCISVSVDQAKNREAALGFLKERGATFPNYWLNEGQTFWQERFNISGPPTVFVFDRDGRRAGKFVQTEQEYEYKDVEALVKELLKAAP